MLGFLLGIRGLYYSCCLVLRCSYSHWFVPSHNRSLFQILAPTARPTHLVTCASCLWHHTFNSLGNLEAFGPNALPSVQVYSHNSTQSSY
ncbi:hypothetical protein RSAG8_08918, partial [Rhizoctonia solani AG-8 WAC10335]